MNNIINFLFFILITIINFNALALPTSEVTIKVVDESNIPIVGAEVGIGFQIPKSSGWGSISNRVKGLTDSDGLFTGSNETEPYISYSATKEGYYGTGASYDDFKKSSGILGFRKWQPWNPTLELVLKEVINPVPLYVVRAGTYTNHIEFPEKNKFIGYDLIERDWVVPYGKGIHKDFLFKLEGEFIPSPMYVDETLTIKFENPEDGIQSIYVEPALGSLLRLPHHAPASGYQSKLVQRSKSDDKKVYISYERDDQNFFFRIRTETDEKGNIASALYGKIHGVISSTMGSIREPNKSSLNFTYYLNPTPNDTNLEFDTEKNLFTDLKDSETMRNP